VEKRELSKIDFETVNCTIERMTREIAPEKAGFV
jgi:hypothetical protein